MWASDEKYPTLERIKKEGMACIGLLALLLRRFNQPLPFLDENNFPDVCKNENWKDPKEIPIGIPLMIKVYSLVMAVQTNGCTSFNM